MTANRHIVDQLADVRAQIKALQEIEAALKPQVAEIIDRADVASGDDFIATHQMAERKGSLNEKAMRAAGIDVDSFRGPSTVVISIRLAPRTAAKVAA
jgi:hypothetical protein